MDEAESAAAIAEAEERVRRSVARSLHDDLQQHLHSLRVRIGLLESRMSRGDAVDAAAVADLGRRTDDAVTALRSAITAISPPTEHDLVAALRDVMERTTKLHGLHVDTDIDTTIAEPSPERCRVLVDAARELLFNVVKHAGVDRARLRLSRTPDALVLEVSDAGENTGAPDATGFGLGDLRERTTALGASLDVAHRGGGTTVTLRMPLGVSPGRSSG